MFFDKANQWPVAMFVCFLNNETVYRARFNANGTNVPYDISEDAVRHDVFVHFLSNVDCAGRA